MHGLETLVDASLRVSVLIHFIDTRGLDEVAGRDLEVREPFSVTTG